MNINDQQILHLKTPRDALCSFSGNSKIGNVFLFIAIILFVWSNPGVLLNHWCTHSFWVTANDHNLLTILWFKLPENEGICVCSALTMYNVMPCINKRRHRGWFWGFIFVKRKKESYSKLLRFLTKISSYFISYSRTKGQMETPARWFFSFFVYKEKIWSFSDFWQFIFHILRQKDAQAMWFFLFLFLYIKTNLKFFIFWNK